MAYTFTVAGSGQGQTVFGNQRVQMGVLTADASSGIVSFGFGVLTHVEWSPKSMTTNNSAVAVRFRLNATAANTSSAGDLGVSGLVSGDEVYLTVYGR